MHVTTDVFQIQRQLGLSRQLQCIFSTCYLPVLGKTTTAPTRLRTLNCSGTRINCSSDQRTNVFFHPYTFSLGSEANEPRTNPRRAHPPVCIWLHAPSFPPLSKSLFLYKPCRYSIPYILSLILFKPHVFC